MRKMTLVVCFAALPLLAGLSLLISNQVSHAQLFQSGEKKAFVMTCLKQPGERGESRCACIYDIVVSILTPDQISFLVAGFSDDLRSLNLLIEKHGMDWAQRVQPIFMQLVREPRTVEKCNK